MYSQIQRQHQIGNVHEHKACQIQIQDISFHSRLTILQNFAQLETNDYSKKKQES